MAIVEQGSDIRRLVPLRAYNILRVLRIHFFFLNGIKSFFIALILFPFHIEINLIIYYNKIFQIILFSMFYSGLLKNIWLLVTIFILKLV